MMRINEDEEPGEPTSEHSSEASEEDVLRWGMILNLALKNLVEDGVLSPSATLEDLIAFAKKSSFVKEGWSIPKTIKWWADINLSSTT